MKRLNLYNILRKILKKYNKDLFSYNEIILFSDKYAELTISIKNIDSSIAKNISSDFCKSFLEFWKSDKAEWKEECKYNLKYFFKNEDKILYLIISETPYTFNISSVYGRNRYYKGFESKIYSLPKYEEVDNYEIPKRVETYDLKDIIEHNLIPVESILTIRETVKDMQDMQDVRFKHILERSLVSNYTKIFNRRTFHIDKKSPRVLKTLHEFGFNVFITSWEYIVKSQKSLRTLQNEIDIIGRDVFDDNMNVYQNKKEDDLTLPILYFTEGYTPIIIEDNISRSLISKGIPEIVLTFGKMFNYWTKVFYQLNYSEIQSKFAILTYMLEKADMEDNHYFCYRIIVYKKGILTPIIDTLTEPVVKTGDEWLSNNFHYTVKNQKGIPVVKDMLRFNMTTVLGENNTLIITLPSIDVLRDTIATRVYKNNDLKYMINIDTKKVSIVSDDILNNTQFLTDIQKESLTKKVEINPVPLASCIVWLIKKHKLTKKQLKLSLVYKSLDSIPKNDDLDGMILIKFPIFTTIEDIKKDFALKSADPVNIVNSEDYFQVKFNGVRVGNRLIFKYNLYDKLLKDGYITEEEYKDDEDLNIISKSGNIFDEINYIKSNYSDIEVKSDITIKLKRWSHGSDKVLQRTSIILKLDASKLNRTEQRSFVEDLREFSLIIENKQYEQFIKRESKGIISLIFFNVFGSYVREERSISMEILNLEDLKDNNLIVVTGESFCSLNNGNLYTLNRDYSDLFTDLGIKVIGVNDKGEINLFNDPFNILGISTKNVPSNFLGDLNNNSVQSSLGWFHFDLNSIFYINLINAPISSDFSGAYTEENFDKAINFFKNIIFGNNENFKLNENFFKIKTVLDKTLLTDKFFWYIVKGDFENGYLNKEAFKDIYEVLEKGNIESLDRNNIPITIKESYTVNRVRQKLRDSILKFYLKNYILFERFFVIDRTTSNIVINEYLNTWNLSRIVGGFWIEIESDFYKIPVLDLDRSNIDQYDLIDLSSVFKELKIVKINKNSFNIDYLTKEEFLDRYNFVNIFKEILGKYNIEFFDVGFNFSINRYNYDFAKLKFQIKEKNNLSDEEKENLCKDFSKFKFIQVTFETYIYADFNLSDLLEYKCVCLTDNERFYDITRGSNRYHKNYYYSVFLEILGFDLDLDGFLPLINSPKHIKDKDTLDVPDVIDYAYKKESILLKVDVPNKQDISCVIVEVYSTDKYFEIYDGNAQYFFRMIIIDTNNNILGDRYIRTMDYNDYNIFTRNSEKKEVFVFDNKLIIKGLFGSHNLEITKDCLSFKIS